MEVYLAVAEDDGARVDRHAQVVGVHGHLLLVHNLEHETYIYSHTSLFSQGTSEAVFLVPK